MDRADRVRLRPKDLGVALGSALILLLAWIDAHWGPDRTITTAVAIGPFFTALLAGPGRTAGVAALAVALALLSGAWNYNTAEVDYFLRVAVVLTGGGFAVAAARLRERLAADRRRFALLREAAAMGDATATVPEVVARTGALLVPAVADACAIDTQHERLGVAGDPALAERLRGRSPARASGGALRETPEPGVRASLTVPLRTRGRALGALTLLSANRAYTPADLEFTRLLGGRIALALDNAGLSAEVESLEAQLTTALGALAEAVTIQDESGAVVYANDAAAKMFGFASGAELMAAAPSEIVEAYEGFHEDGSPLRVDEFPGRLVLAGERPPPLLIRSVHKHTGEERWRVVKATPVPRAAGPPLAINVIEDVTDVKHAEIAQRLLADAGAVLAGGDDEQTTLARFVDVVVPRFADWCAATLIAESGQPVLAASAGPEELATRVGPDAIARVLRSARPVTPEGPERPAALVVPLLAGGDAVGALSLARAASGFSGSDSALATALGARAGAAVEHARLYRERSRIAATLQHGLLPEALPEIPGLRLASLYRPAGTENLVGGDFYDAFETPSGWIVLVGDVTGRGADAAALTGQARHTLRSAGALLDDPHDVVALLNQALTQRSELKPCTVALVHLSPGARTATVLCAGHPQPLLVRGGTVRAVGHFGPVLGAWGDSRWRTDTVELEPGDVLVLYTDGVTDAVGAHGRFGDTRLFSVLREVRSADEAVAAIDRALSAFQRGGQTDDTAVIALDVRP
jgi:PAS domain S-box-containing protein